MINIIKCDRCGDYYTIHDADGGISHIVFKGPCDKNIAAYDICPRCGIEMRVGIAEHVKPTVINFGRQLSEKELETITKHYITPNYEV